MEKFSLSIDGKNIEVKEGTSVLEAAQKLGIDVPNLCFEPCLSLSGSCRICVVEDDNSGRMLASCAMPAMQGMVIKTESPRVLEARRFIIELMLASHDLDCFNCEKNGDCRLQDYAYRYKVDKSPFWGEKREFSIDEENPFYLRDYNKCIYCGKCVRVCHEVQGAGAIDYSHRGFYSQISSPYEVPIQDSSCVFCGMCIELCPVGALMPKHQIFAGRPWEVKNFDTVCPYCGVGCNLTLKVKDNNIADVHVPDREPNNGEICVKGKFGWDFISHNERLKKPLIKKNGHFQESSWEEALETIANRFSDIKKTHGSDALAGLSSAKCTNEENYLFQKFFRSVLGTHNIDHCARL